MKIIYTKCNSIPSHTHIVYKKNLFVYFQEKQITTKRINSTAKKNAKLYSRDSNKCKFNAKILIGEMAIALRKTYNYL